MSKLAELRNLGYGITLLPGSDIDIQLPANQELTQKLRERLAVIKPNLIEDLEFEQETKGGGIDSGAIQPERINMAKGGWYWSW